MMISILLSCAIFSLIAATKVKERLYWPQLKTTPFRVIIKNVFCKFLTAQFYKSYLSLQAGLIITEPNNRNEAGKIYFNFYGGISKGLKYDWWTVQHFCRLIFKISRSLSPTITLLLAAQHINSYQSKNLGPSTTMVITPVALAWYSEM